MCFFPSKVPFLINTYLKSMRKEFLVLEFHASSFAFSRVVTFITVGIWLNLNAAFFYRSVLRVPVCAGRVSCDKASCAGFTKKYDRESADV